MKTQCLSRRGLLLSTILCLSTVASAQLPCFVGDDGLASACCELLDPDLPSFPAVELKGRYACILDCIDLTTFDVEVRIEPPDFFTCDMAWLRVSITPAQPGAPSFSGRLIAKYSRTWTVAEEATQVWRFLLNGDVFFGPNFGFDCPVPPHDGPSHFVGSIDYTCDPFGSDESARVALNLSHLPGCISHGSLSARPLSGTASHPRYSYHLVAPEDFSFLSNTAVQGEGTSEAVRSSSLGDCFPSSYGCRGEVPLEKVGLRTLAFNCPCFSFVPGRWEHQQILGRGNCDNLVSSFEGAGNFDPVVPTGMLALPLGQWNGAAWPGGTELSVMFGYLDHTEPCGPAADLQPSRVTGVATSGVPGVLFSGPTDPLFDHFVDLQDQLLGDNALCEQLVRGFGRPAYASIVWNLNPQ